MSKENIENAGHLGKSEIPTDKSPVRDSAGIEKKAHISKINVPVNVTRIGEYDRLNDPENQNTF